MRSLKLFPVAALLAVAGLLARPQPAAAQVVETYGGCFDALRCVVHRDTTDAMRRETGTALFVGGTTLVVFSNAIWGWDRDAGGYADVFYQEKGVAHFATAAILTETAIAAHVRPSFAVIWTNVAGLGFEMSQGYVNPHDLAANALGSFAGYALARWLSPLRFR